MAKAINEKYLSIKVARETHVFYISIRDEKIVHRTLLKQIMMSAEKIKYKNKRDRDIYHLCINGRHCKDSFNDDFVYKEKIQTIELCTLDATGKSNSVKRFENIKDANIALFQHIYNNDYLYDERKYRECFFTYEEAENRFDEFFAEINNIDLLVSKSILRKKKMLKRLRNEKEIERISLKRENKEKEILSLINLIDKIENETLGQTAKRLSEAIGHYTNKDILFDATRRIRGE